MQTLKLFLDHLILRPILTSKGIKTFYIREKKYINKYHSSDLERAPLLNIGPAVAEFFLFCFKNVCFKDNHWD